MTSPHRHAARGLVLKTLMSSTFNSGPSGCATPDECNVTTRLNQEPPSDFRSHFRKYEASAARLPSSATCLIVPTRSQACKRDRLRIRTEALFPFVAWPEA